MDLSDILLLFIIISIICSRPSDTQRPDTRLASACYGTSNNFLELSCPEGEIINVTKVLYGAKLTEDNCPNPTVNNEHNASCCYQTDTDCVILPAGTGEKPDPYMILCANKTTCSLQTTWMDTTGHCGDEYLSHTNFMELSYICLKKGANGTHNAAAAKPSSSSASASTSTSTSTTSTVSTTLKTTSRTTTTATTTKSTPSTTARKQRTEQQTMDPYSLTTQMTKPTTQEDMKRRSGTSQLHLGSHTSPNEASTVSPKPTTTVSPSPGRHVELDVSFTTASATPPTPKSGTSSFAFTTGILGGMTAAVVGLMLTIFGFLFYWGRRKRKMTTMKPNNSTVWDFLLAHTVAARTFRRGYDNFSNNRESVSSEGEIHQGKQTWLPNIRVEPNIETQSVTSDENCSIVNINAIGNGNDTVSSSNDRSEA